MSRRRTAMVCGQMCTAPEGDYFVTCSFDENHVILRSRLPYHIVKCLKQHPNHNKKQCPYDCTEYIDADKYGEHILNCESKRSAADGKFHAAYLRKSGLMCNIQQTPFFHKHAPMPTDDWEGGQEPRGNSELYYDAKTETYFEGSSGQFPDEFDEDLFDNIRPVGRGMSRRQEEKPKKGMGRAEMLKFLYELNKKTRSSSSHSSSSVSGSRKDDEARRHDVSVDQFKDA